MRSTLWSRTSLIGSEENRGVGSMMSRSNFLAPDTFAIATCWGSVSLSLESEATKNSATASNGSMVAEMPIR